jgi:hypothetical protein
MGLLAFLLTEAPVEESPRARYEALVKEFETAQKAFVDAYSKATNDERLMAASLASAP